MSERFTVTAGDMLEVLRMYPDNHFDAIVTDPPYALQFMGQQWDNSVPGQEYWRECLRVAKPGAHIVASGATRTFHRLTCAIEDGGWLVRDCLFWLHGQGFPKGADVGKAIDRERNDREDILRVTEFVKTSRDAVGITNPQIDTEFKTNGMAGHWTSSLSQPAVPSLEQWERLKVLLQMSDAMDSEVHRLNARKNSPGAAFAERPVTGVKGYSSPVAHMNASTFSETYNTARVTLTDTTGATDNAKRWEGFNTQLKPAVEPFVLARKPTPLTTAQNVVTWQTGALNIGACRIGNELITAHGGGQNVNRIYGGGSGMPAIEAGSNAHTGRHPANILIDSEVANELGDRSRYFFCSKAGRAERVGSNHPTQKPVDLMRWLLRLVTAPGSLVLDPFCGSGSTGVAAMLEGRRFVGVDLSPEYIDIAHCRIQEACEKESQ